MDRFSFLGSVHTGFVEDLYQRYITNPDGIEPSWRAFFQGFDFARENYDDKTPVSVAPTVAIPESVEKEFKVLNLINGYRTRGHLFTLTNPVRARRTYSPTLDIENFGLTQSDLNTTFNAGSEVGLKEHATLQKIVDHLQAIYCESIGVEYMYMRDPERIAWLRDRIHVNHNTTTFSLDQKRRILHKLNEAVAFENFLNTKFVGQKRFSIEGAETMIPALDLGIAKAVELGVAEIVLGMAHRGRLNVLTNIFASRVKKFLVSLKAKSLLPMKNLILMAM